MQKTQLGFLQHIRSAVLRADHGVLQTGIFQSPAVPSSWYLPLPPPFLRQALPRAEPYPNPDPPEKPTDRQAIVSPVREVS